MAMLAVLTVVTPVTVQAPSPALREVDITVTVETPDPSLAPALPTGHPSSPPTLVTGLDHPGVGDGDQPHLVPEHPPRSLLYLPGQRSRTLRPLRSVKIKFGVWSVRGVTPAGLPPLSEGLELVVQGRHVLHPSDHHLPGGLSPVAHVGAHVLHQVGPGLLLRQGELCKTVQTDKNFGRRAMKYEYKVLPG